MENLDITELIIENMPNETEIQERIKLYMQTHKSNCNNFIYEKYKKETTYFNAIFKSLACDLGAEILRTMQAKSII